MTAVLQKTIPYDVLAPSSLPGIAPLDPQEWLIVDEAYAAQMALRCDLLQKRPQDVFQLAEAALPAAQEALDLVLNHLDRRDDFALSGTQVRCPDGRSVSISQADPLVTLGQLLQEDICLLQKPEGADEHLLTGAVLCFPAGWTLREKFMQPLLRIHKPVAEYDANIAKRVQRLFDGVRADRPLWRKNALWYDDPALYAPRPENAPRSAAPLTNAAYLRSERQSILRLPKTDAVIFSIHTFVVRAQDILPAG